MALSGSFTTTALTEYGCTVSFTFSWTATQSIENNKSLIDWSLKTNMNPSTYSRGVRKVYITRDSTQVYSQVWSYNSLHNVTGGTVLASGTNYEIAHDPDGSKSFTFNVYVNVGRSDENTWTNTGSQNVTLNTIPRASTMSLSPADPTTLTQITASVTRATSTFKHTITTSYAGYTYTLGTAKFDTSASFTIPAGIKTSMKAANASSVVLPLTLTTYSGNTIVGSKDYSLTVKAPVATVSASPASVACNANTTWTLSNTDTESELCTYTVTRSYNGTVRYTDQTKVTTTSKSNAANTAFEQDITQTPSGTITIRVTTFVGTTEVGSNTVDYTCTIPTGTYKPTLTVSSQLSRVNKISYTYITGITFLAGYDGASGKMTEGVANSSHAEIDTRTITVSGNKASRTVSLNGSTATINLDTFSSSTDDYNVTVTYRITDKRGGYAEQSFNAITVRGYSKPRFNSYIVQRATSAGVVNSEGTYANITASASAHSIKNTSSTELNSMSSITYKLGTIGTEETSGADTSGLNGTINKTAYHSTDYSITQQYTFTLTATDSVGQSTTVSYLLPKAAIALSLHKNTGVGLGTTAIASQATIALDTTVTRGHSLTVERGNVYLGTSTAATEQNVGLYSSAGSMFIYNSGQQNKRGIRLPRHGTGSAKDVFTIDTNNDITFNGSLSGNASTATTATTASKLGSSNMGSTNQPIYLSGGSPTLGSKYIPISDSNVADGEYKFQNASYAPEIKDTASGIGCANKGSRYLINELLVDGIVAPKTAYSEHSMSTRSNTIQFYKYSGNSGGQWTGLTKTAYIDTSGIYHPQVSRTDTYMLAGLVGVAISATQLRVQIPVPSGYSNFTPALVSGQTTANLDYNGTDASFTFSAVAKLDMNPASVSIVLTTSGLTAYRVYGFRNGRVSITLS